MRIEDIEPGQEVYYSRWGKRVTVRLIDEQSEYVTIEDVRSGSRASVHCSKLDKVNGDSDMSIEDTLRREG